MLGQIPLTTMTPQPLHIDVHSGFFFLTTPRQPQTQKSTSWGCCLGVFLIPSLWSVSLFPLPQFWCSLPRQSTLISPWLNDCEKVDNNLPCVFTTTITRIDCLFFGLLYFVYVLPFVAPDISSLSLYFRCPLTRRILSGYSISIIHPKRTKNLLRCVALNQLLARRPRQRCSSLTTTAGLAFSSSYYSSPANHPQHRRCEVKLVKTSQSKCGSSESEFSATIACTNTDHPHFHTHN